MTAHDDYFVVVDVESTGLNPTQDAMIEIAFAVFGRDGIVDQFSQLVDPGRTIPLDVVRLTGITNDDVRGQPRIESLAGEIRRRIGALPIVGHNVAFDIAMLESAGIAVPNRRYDTFRLAQLLLPNIGSYALGAVSDELGVPPAVAHRAMADAERTVAVFLKLQERLGAYDDTTLHQTARFAQLAGWPEATLFQRVAERTLSGPLFAQTLSRDLPPELQFAEPRERPESLQRTGSIEDLDLNQIETLLSTDGPLSLRIDRFEARPTQIRMARAVALALNGDGELVVEAGTGTGKSVAYLLPAALFAIERGERVVVSTNTIALQDQLYRKDLPDVRAALEDAGIEQDLRVAVMKGRNNYLCLRRWFDHMNDEVEDEADASLRAKVLLWLPGTQTGDRAELRLNNDEETHWRKFASERGRCSTKRCNFARVNQCFLYRARHNALSAHIVIVNHSLVLSNRSQGFVLPPFRRLIIDEAHHLEDEATSQFTWFVNRLAIDEPVRAIINTENVAPAGYLAIAASFFSRLRNPEAVKVSGQAMERLSDAAERATSLLAVSGELMQRLGGLLPSPRRSGASFSDRLRITDAVRYRGEWIETSSIWRTLDSGLGSIRETGAWFLQTLDALTLPDDKSNPDAAMRDELTLEVTAALEQIDEVRHHLNTMFSDENDKTVMWIERSVQNAMISVHGAPLDVSEMLQEEVFRDLQVKILTSATLTIDGSFRYVTERLGLYDATTLPLGSPFDHQRSTLLFVPDDMPDPKHAQFQAALNDMLINLVTATHGRALVLFTSHGQLQATRRGIKAPLEKRNIAVLGQRIDGNFRQLIENLRTNPGTVLLGTSSFWEGVDIVGDALSLLVIVKLPFPVPSDPVFEARGEQLANPFEDLSVPMTILKFKQGFGRLIRSSHDRGVCVVADNRVIRRGYGQEFLHSLPPSRVIIGSSQDIGAYSQAWLEDERLPVSIGMDEGGHW